MLLYSLRELMKNNVHIGHYKWECDYRLSYFIIGIRNLIHVINLYYTLYILRQSLYIIHNMGYMCQRVWIINNIIDESNKCYDNYRNEEKKLMVKKNFQNGMKENLLIRFEYFNKKWVGGILTNQKMMYLNNKNLFFKYYGLNNRAILPSYVFVSNIENTKSSIFEAIILNIPSSSLFDTNQGFYGIFYPLNSNDDSYLSRNLFTRLFVRVYLKGNLEGRIFEQKTIFLQEKKKKRKLFEFPYRRWKRKKFKWIKLRNKYNIKKKSFKFKYSNI